MSYEEKLKKLLNGLSQKQKKALTEFANTLHKISPSSKLIYLQWLKAFTVFVHKDLNKVTRRDIDSYLSTLNSDSTYNSEVIILKRFFKDNKALQLTDLKVRKKDLQISPSELLTHEEVIRLANAMGSQMLRAFVLTLYESSARVSEVLALRIGDIEFDSVKDSKGKDGLLTRLNFSRSKGKVLKQPVVMSMFALELKSWLDSHPHKNNPQAYVFYSEKYAKDGSKPLTCPRFKQAARLAGITKRSNPHWLRHSMLSYLSNHLNYNEQLLMWRAGWKNTTMAKRYIHSGAELENNAYLQKLGYMVEKKDAEPIKPKPCFHCQNLNPYTNDKCNYCGMPLDSVLYEKELRKRQFLRSFDPEEVFDLKKKLKATEAQLAKLSDGFLERDKGDIVRYIAARSPTNEEMSDFMRKRRIDVSLLQELSDERFGGCVQFIDGHWLYNKQQDKFGYGFA